MPSTQLFSQSGGIGLVADGSAFYSGSPQLKYGVTLKYEASGTEVFVGLPNLSGTVNTSTSGGSLSSGGLADGVQLTGNQSYFVPQSRLVSGLETIRLLVPAGSSGERLFWEVDTRTNF